MAPVVKPGPPTSEPFTLLGRIPGFIPGPRALAPYPSGPPSRDPGYLAEPNSGNASSHVFVLLCASGASRHHSRANRSGITSQGHTGIGVSYLGAARTLRVVTFRVPALGIRGRANSRTPSGDPGLRWGDEAVPQGTSDRRSDVAEEPARQCWLWASATLARASHLSNAPTPPSRSHMFIRSASLASISRFRAARRFHRSATPIRFCRMAIHPTIKDSSLKPGSSPSSSTTASAKPSTRSIFAKSGAVS